MIHHPILIFLALVALVAFLKKVRASPLPFWCYIVPMCATTLGLLPAESELYTFLSQQLLPICIVLLLIGTDLKGVVQLGPLAIGLMLIGSFGTMVGGLMSYRLYCKWLPTMSWAGIGALSASWIGGSANLLAVKEALQVPDTLVGPLVIVDAVVAYSWMALLIWASSLQNRWNRFVFGSSVPACPADAPLVPPQPCLPAGRRVGTPGLLTPRPTGGLATSIVLSVTLSLLAHRVGQWLPTFGQVMSPATWTVLLVTTAALVLSLTPLRQVEEAGASSVGTFALYILLASIGARANLMAIAKAPVFLALGLTWIAIHGVILLVAGKLLKAPLGLIATASQANIGGPISAPIVGATYSVRLSSVGLLMAILGNILGTYLGLVTAWVARLAFKTC